MSRICFIFGLIWIIVFGIIQIPRMKLEYLTLKKGELLEVKVISTSLCFSKKAKLYFQYKDEILVKHISCGKAQKLKANDKIYLKKLDNSDVFLFPNENNLVSFLLLNLIGLLIIVYGFLEKSIFKKKVNIRKPKLKI